MDIVHEWLPQGGVDFVSVVIIIFSLSYNVVCFVCFLFFVFCCCCCCCFFGGDVYFVVSFCLFVVVVGGGAYVYGVRFVFSQMAVGFVFPQVYTTRIKCWATCLLFIVPKLPLMDGIRQSPCCDTICHPREDDRYCAVNASCMFVAFECQYF